MTTRQLCSELARREGKGKQVLNAAQAQEVVRCLGDILSEMCLWDALKLVYSIRARGRNRTKKIVLGARVK